MAGQLAVIIPAYKETYLFSALESLANQSCGDFTVYIGDDCSPFEIKATCDQFSKKLNLRYHRFEVNLGSKDLVGQWERCVGLIGDEKWIWLFSDDDIADKDCVERFYQSLESTEEGYDVYRFNTMVIDAQAKFISQADPSPEVENPMSLACNILYWKRGNSMPDHIFSAAKYAELHGFVNFPFAQGSDWATSINFSYPKGLFTISGPKVRWRQSGQNVSSVASAKKKEMILGHLQFLEWILKRFDINDERRYTLSLNEIRGAALYNLRAVFLAHYKGIPMNGFAVTVKRISEIFQISQMTALRICLGINYTIVKPKFRSAIKKLIFPASRL